MRKDAWTRQKFYNRFNELSDKDLYTVVELPEKLSSKTKVTFSCIKGHIFKSALNNFFHGGTRCSICNKNIWSYEKFWDQFNNLPDKDLYTINELPKVLSATSKISVTCKENHTFLIGLDSFFNRNNRCYICKKNIWTHARFWNKYNLLTNKELYSEIKLPDKLTAKSKVSFTCIHNHKCQLRLDHFFSEGEKCQACNGQERWTHDKFWRYYNTVPDKDLFTVKILPDNLYAKTKVTFVCKQGHMFKMTPDKFFTRGQRCRICAGQEPWDRMRFLREMQALPDENKYIFSDYNNVNSSNSKFSVFCKKCKNKWRPSVHHFFSSKSRCPTCNESKSEEKIAALLMQMKVTFERQKVFDNCRNILPLRFDFCISEYKLIIEYNGKQHYFPICFGNDKTIERANDNLKGIQHRDAIKKQWAISNGFTFVEIRYDEMDQIESKLIDLLNVYYI